MSIKALAKTIAPGWLWSRLQSMQFMREYRQRIRRYEPRVVHHMYGGHPLSVQLQDPTGERWYDQDWAEPSEIGFLRRHGLNQGANVFDIGAHQCVVALMLAKVVGPDGFVLAVEANPHNAKVGEINRQLNSADRLQVVNAAVGETSGTLTINQLMNGRVDSTRRYGALTVPSISLDELAIRYGRPGHVIVDVEGFECQVLRGSSDLLADRLNWCVEVHVGCGLEDCGNTAEQVLSFFPRDHYDLYIGSGEDGSVEFQISPFREDREVLRSRFFLLAVGRRS